MSVVIAATGHRPDKLGGYTPTAYLRLLRIASVYLSSTKPDKVISGMALGWDMAFAEAAQAQRIPVVAAVPFEGQQSKWPESSQQHWQRLVNAASEVVFVSQPGYAAWKMQVRNEWMVDRATSIAALWNGSAGGTQNCLMYAQRKNVPFENLWQAFCAC